MTAWTLIIITALTITGFLAGRARAYGLVRAGNNALHSLPSYHGLLTASVGFLAASLVTLIISFTGGSNSLFMPAAAAVLGTSAIAAAYSRISAPFRARKVFEQNTKSPFEISQPV